MKLVTVATHSESYFPFLLESCNRYGAELVVLGFNQPWQGFNHRNVLMKEYLKSLPPDEVVCFIDAYDVLLLRPLEDLEAFFVNFNKVTGARIIVGCDQTATGEKLSLNSQLYFGACNNKHVNAGTYIGYVADLRDMISHILNKISDDVEADDQLLIRKYCSATKHVHIDCDRIFFLTLVGGKNMHFPLNHPKINVVVDPDSHDLHFNNIRPFFVHGAGHINMLNLVEALGYDVSPEQRSAIQKYNEEWVDERMYLRTIPLVIAIVILFIVLVVILILTKIKTLYR